MTPNSLQDELWRCLINAQSDESGTVTLEFCYPETLSAFRGHFPGNPILPGVCLFQSLRIGLEQVWSTPLRLAEIVNAKFIAPVLPGATLHFNVRESDRSGDLVSVKVRVTRGDERVAEFSIKLLVIAKP